MKSMTLKKLLCGALALCMAVGLAGCGGNDDNKGSVGNDNPSTSAEDNQEGDSADTTTYTFETEYTYMDDVVGGGISGAAAGLNMIVESGDASNGFYVGSTHSTKCVITFKVTSDTDAPATLRVIVGSELGTMNLNSDSFIISVNGTAVNYDAFSIPAEAKTTGKTFTQFKLGDIDLKSGENTITFQVGPNEYCNGGPGGPLFDAIKLTSTATLTMEEYPENIE